MRKLTPLVLVSAVALGGCTIFQPKAARLDEFAVARNAPLTIPPDYTLTPPATGSVGLSASDAQSQAIEALFGGPAPRSDSETSLLEQAGRDRVALGARSVAGDPGTQVVDKGAATQAIIAAAEGDSQDATAQTPQ